jgi:trk system potassium uptake protein TrkA
VSILIIGGGDIGATLTSHLAAEGKNVVLVEANEDRVHELNEIADVKVIHGNGASPRVLREAGLAEAEMLIAVTNLDEVNLVACLVASQQAVIPTKIARVRDPELASAMPGIFGDDPLDLNINPEEEAAHAVLKTLNAPGAVGVFEFAGGRVQVMAFSVDEPCDAVGVVLADLKPKLGIDTNIVAVSRDEDLIIPDGRTQIKRGDLIYAAGRPDALGALAELLGKKSAPPRRIVISGGGNVTYCLARLLEKNQDLTPKIIEQDAERCKFLVEQLKRSVVLHGQGTDPVLLAEESVGHADAFLALTRVDEDNVLSALLAKRAGASKVMALVNKASYTPLVKAIGIDAVVSPNRAAVSAILHFIRKGKVVSVIRMGEEAAEALEVVALETSELVGRPLSQAGFHDAVVGAIVRGDDVIIPSGKDQIEVGDHVVIFALHSAIAGLERQMMVDLRYF